jgi:hypothetical protein
MGTGPFLTNGFDIAATELDDSFLLETSTVAGQGLLNGLPLEDAIDDDLKEKAPRIEGRLKMMRKSIGAAELPGLICRNLDQPHWADITKRDLECGNCTQVCPACFCSSTYDLVRLRGITRQSQESSGARVRKWDSCFSRNFAPSMEATSDLHGGRDTAVDVEEAGLYYETVRITRLRELRKMHYLMPRRH